MLTEPPFFRASKKTQLVNRDLSPMSEFAGLSVSADYQGWDIEPLHKLAIAGHSTFPPSGFITKVPREFRAVQELLLAEDF